MGLLCSLEPQLQPSSKSHCLLLFPLTPQADQDDMASYSMTQAVVEARDVPENSLQFSQSLYHGTVVLGSEADTAVKDRTSPSETLRIQAQYSDFLVCSPFLIAYELSKCAQTLVLCVGSLGWTVGHPGPGLTAFSPRTSTRTSRIESPIPQISGWTRMSC